MLDLGITVPAWDDIKASVLHLWDQLYASMPGWLQDVLSFFGLGSGSADAGKTALNEAVNSLATMTNTAAASIGSLSGAAAAAAEHISEAFTGESGTAHTGSGSKFAGGLWNVPWDNYMARLHSGEMVLTADEARRYRAQTAAGGTVYNDTASIYIDKYNQYSGEDANALLQQCSCCSGGSGWDTASAEGRPCRPPLFSLGNENPNRWEFERRRIPCSPISSGMTRTAAPWA